MPLHPDSFYGRIWLGVIDRVVLGFLAAVIVFSVQKFIQDREDKRQQLIEAARLESQFIDNTLNEVHHNMVAYYQVEKNIRRTGRRIENKEKSKMVEYETAVEQSLLLLENLAGPRIIQDKHKENFDELIRSMDELNSVLGKDPEDISAGERRQQSKNLVDEVKKNHGKVLRSLREAALEAVRLERDVGVTIESIRETDQAE